MSSSSDAPSMPSDPDPTPTPATFSAEEIQSASRNERKKIAKSYGRHKTILAGDTDQNGKKTILGG